METWTTTGHPWWFNFDPHPLFRALTLPPITMDPDVGVPVYTIFLLKGPLPERQVPALKRPGG